MSHADSTIPPAVKTAAKRGFIRTTAQAYAATLSGGITTTAVLAIATGEVDVLTTAVTVGVALVTPPIAGLASFLSIIARGVPEDYTDAATPVYVRSELPADIQERFDAADAFRGGLDK